MNLSALAGVAFGSALTYATTDSPKLTLMGAATGLCAVGILSSKEVSSGAGDFTKSACASMWPILFADELRPEPIPYYLEPDFSTIKTEEDLEDIILVFDDATHYRR